MLQTFISFINKIRDWETIMLYPLNKCHLYITFIKFRTVLYGYQRLCVQVSHLLSCKGMQTYSSNRNIIHRFLMAYNIFIGTAWTSLKEHAVNKLSMILPKNMGNLS
jgi:hypothetical protein